MKTKLLKKVRKRFEIIHMPAGFVECGERYEYNLFKLTDSTNSWYERFAQLEYRQGKQQFCEDHNIFQTKADCIYSLQKLIVKRLISEGHRGKKDRAIRNSHFKVWHNSL
jgi:hypothetical protein